MIAITGTTKTYNLSTVFLVKPANKYLKFRIPTNVDKFDTHKPISVIIKEIEDLSGLLYNWDDDGSEAITNKSISKAREIVSALNLNGIPVDYVFPMRTGGIQLEIDDLKEFIEIEVSPEGDTKFIVYDLNNDIIKTFELLFEGIEYLKQNYKKL